MYSKICPVCKSKIYGVNCKKADDSLAHSKCRSNKKFEKAQKERPQRTSTPIPDFENNTAEGFSDSVSDFFYQSWKSGLHSDDSIRSQSNLNGGFNQPNLAPQPVCYAPQIIYVHQIIYPPLVPPMGGYVQRVGYRPDGTYGVLPPYWSYNYFNNC